MHGRLGTRWSCRQGASGDGSPGEDRAGERRHRGATGGTADEAFDVPVKHLQHDNRKLRDIANDPVATKVRRPTRPSETATSTRNNDHRQVSTSRPTFQISAISGDV